MSLFGLESNYIDAQLVLIPVPWEATTSYGSGAALGPKAILEASPQLDLYTYDKKNSHQSSPLHLLPIDEVIYNKNIDVKKIAQLVIKNSDDQLPITNKINEAIEQVNTASENLNSYVYQQSKKIIQDNKIASVIGGDHSCPLGLIKALSEIHSEYCILHIDAHLDLRESYQGFKNSHASIMYNVLNLPNPPKDIISVGIRDYCQEEFAIVKSKNLSCFTDQLISSSMYNGKSFNSIIESVLDKISSPVYISFDIDGLEPRFCPNTGTPVPGGLDFNQAKAILNSVGLHKKVIGFDLCEVAPDQKSNNQWDGNVGARILFSLYKTIFRN